MRMIMLACAPRLRRKNAAVRALLLGGCAALSFAEIAHAQESSASGTGSEVDAAVQTTDDQGTPTGDAASSEEEIIVEGTRAVTATKTDTPLREIPQSISVITSQQMRDQGALTMMQATNYTAGTTNGGFDPRGDFVFIRGFWAVNYLDGLKREFGFVYLPRSETFTLERIDVLLGPSAVLYGAGSAGGLVNMQTKRPVFDFGGEVTASYGTYDRKQVQFDVTGPLSETVAARLVGVYRDSDSLVRYMPDDRLVIQPSITWRPSQNTEVSVLGLYQRDYTGTGAYMPLAATLYAPKGRRMDRRTFLGEPDVNRGPKTDKWLTLLVNHKFSEALQFRSSSRIERGRTRYGEIYGVYFLNPEDPFLDADNEVIPRSIFAIRAKYKTFQSDNHLQFDFETGPLEHSLLVGVDHSRFGQDSRQAFAFLGATPINIYDPVYGLPGNEPVFGAPTRQRLTNTGLYIQDQIRFNDIASLVVGARRDRLKSENTGLPNQIDHATTFRAGLTVDVAKGVTPYVSYSESFQPVSGLNQFNKSFDPLFGRSYEAGLKLEPIRGAMIRLTYYDILENNYLRPDPSQPLNQIQSGFVKSKGVELQANYAVARDFTLSAAFARNSTRASGDNRQADNMPKTTASLFGTKNIALNDDMLLRVGGGVRHVGRQTSGAAEFFQVVTPSFTLIDAMAAIDFNQWTLQVNGRNLLDKYYYAACSQYGSCTNGDPLNINVGLTYRF